MPASRTQLIGGKFQDGAGNLLVDGYLKMVLNQDETVASVGSICSGIEITIKLNSSASVDTSTAQYVWGTDVMLPVNSYYKVTGFTAAGQPAWGPNVQQVVSGATFDVGTWIPNQVISWTNPNPAVTFENNGTLNSSQQLLNLESTDASITITDEGGGTINLQAAGGAAFSGSGAFFFGPGIVDLTFLTQNVAGINAQSAAGNVVANQVVVYLFELLAEFTISKATANCITSTAGKHASFGIYSYAGNKLVDGGQFITTTVAGIQTNSFTPVTLSPGVYWHAQTADTNLSAEFIGLLMAGTGNDALVALWIQNQTRAAIAANASAVGVLPATLGSLTPFIPTHGNGDGACLPLYE